MKLIYVTKDESLELVASELKQFDNFVMENIDAAINEISSDPTDTLLVIDQEALTIKIDEIMPSLFPYRSVVKIVYLLPKNKVTKDLKELASRLGDNAPDSMFVKPVTKETVDQSVQELFPMKDSKGKPVGTQPDETQFMKDLSFVNFDKRKYLEALKSDVPPANPTITPPSAEQASELAKEVQAEVEQSIKMANLSEKSDVQKKFDDVFDSKDDKTEIIKPNESEVPPGPDVKFVREGAPESENTDTENLGVINKVELESSEISSDISLPTADLSLLEGSEKDDTSSEIELNDDLNLESNIGEKSGIEDLLKIETGSENEDLDFSVNSEVLTANKGESQRPVKDHQSDINSGKEDILDSELTFGSEDGEKNIVGENTLKTVIKTLTPDSDNENDISSSDISFNHDVGTTKTVIAERTVSEARSLPSLSFNVKKEDDSENIFSESIEESIEKEPSTEEIAKPSVAPLRSDMPKREKSLKELEKDHSSLRHLRFEREELLKEIERLHEEKRGGDRERIELKAYAEDLSIELTIVKKRFEQEREEFKMTMRTLEQKVAIYEEKIRGLHKDADRISQKYRVDHNSVKRREGELLEQLELIKNDTEIQIKSRDMKILELKRKIDALEYNMENISSAELRMKEDKKKVEEKLLRVIKSLRGSIKMLEGDSDIIESETEILERLKKL